MFLRHTRRAVEITQTGVWDLGHYRPRLVVEFADPYVVFDRTFREPGLDLDVLLEGSQAVVGLFCRKRNVLRICTRRPGGPPVVVRFGEPNGYGEKMTYRTSAVLLRFMATFPFGTERDAPPASDALPLYWRRCVRASPVSQPDHSPS